ncbi:hypothetical protein D5086_023120 [Populus alba]|uniref:Uncharacterized protein n=1 Tax=Populus alba TaxID=43335 RepID=A0ACC4BAH7_POPAL
MEAEGSLLSSPPVRPLRPFVRLLKRRIPCLSSMSLSFLVRLNICLRLGKSTGAKSGIYEQVINSKAEILPTRVRHHSANTLALASATPIVSVSASNNTASMYSSSSVSVSKDFAIEREKDKDKDKDVAIVQDQIVAHLPLWNR